MAISIKILVTGLVLATTNPFALDAMVDRQADFEMTQSLQQEVVDCLIESIAQASVDLCTFGNKINDISQACSIKNPVILAPIVGAGLKKAGKSILDQDIFGKTVLHWAAGADVDIVASVALILAGQKVEKLFYMKDKNSQTAIDGAAMWGNAKCVKILCDKALELEKTRARALICGTVNNKGEMLVHLAAFSNHTETVKVLLDAATTLIGPSDAWMLLFKKDNDGKTPWNYLTDKSKGIISEYCPDITYLW